MGGTGGPVFCFVPSLDYQDQFRGGVGHGRPPSVLARALVSSGARRQIQKMNKGVKSLSSVFHLTRVAGSCNI